MAAPGPASPPEAFPKARRAPGPRTRREAGSGREASRGHRDDPGVAGGGRVGEGRGGSLGGMNYQVAALPLCKIGERWGQDQEGGIKRRKRRRSGRSNWEADV